MYLFVFLPFFRSDVLFERSACLPANDSEEFSHVLNLIEPLGRGDRTTRAFNGRCKLNKHQTVETEITQSRIDRNFSSRTVRGCSNESHQPQRISIRRLLHTATPPGLLTLLE